MGRTDTTDDTNADEDLGDWAKCTPAPPVVRALVTCSDCQRDFPVDQALTRNGDDFLCRECDGRGVWT